MKEKIKIAVLFVLAALYAGAAFAYFNMLLISLNTDTSFGAILLGLVCAFSALGLVHFIEDSIKSFWEWMAKKNTGNVVTNESKTA